MSMAINSFKATPTTYIQNTNNIAKSSKRLSTGKKINSAADDAVGLAIAEKLQKLIAGLDQGTENSYNMQSLLKTAEGGLDTISDSLQRIRELGVQAKNDIYTDSDRSIMQDEVNQLLDQINRTASSTEYNSQTLLDGSYANKHTASYADGSGMTVNIGSVTTDSLGITNFDLTGNFDLDSIDSAINNVNTVRSDIGASVNRLDYTASYTTGASVTQAESLSKIIDTDYAKETISYNTNRLLEQYRIFSIRNQMNNMGNIVNLMI